MDQSYRAGCFLLAAEFQNWDAFNRFFASDVINAIDPKTGMRALDWCIFRRYEPGIRRLLEAKAEVNYHRGKFGGTPLHSVVEWENITFLALLLEHKANVNACNHRGETPLHYLATLLGDTEDDVACIESQCRLLVKNGADLCARNKQGKLPQYEGVIAYRQSFAACKMAQRAWLRIFGVHRQGVLVPDMVRMIGDMIWACRMK